MYSEVFCKVYNEFGWNFYPEIFGEQLLTWIREKGIRVEVLSAFTGRPGTMVGELE